MEATLAGRSGGHAVAPVAKASKSESDYATTQNQLMEADHAAAPVSTLENVRSACVQVPVALLFISIHFDASKKICLCNAWGNLKIKIYYLSICNLGRCR